MPQLRQGTGSNASSDKYLSAALPHAHQHSQRDRRHQPVSEPFMIKQILHLRDLQPIPVNFLSSSQEKNDGY